MQGKKKFFFFLYRRRHASIFYTSSLSLLLPRPPRESEVRGRRRPSIDAAAAGVLVYERTCVCVCVCHYCVCTRRRRRCDERLMRRERESAGDTREFRIRGLDWPSPMHGQPTVSVYVWCVCVCISFDRGGGHYTRLFVSLLIL